MARQGIFTGSSPNDGTGDPLVVGAVKVNQNFSEIYSTFGDGTNLVSYSNNSGTSTVAQGLTGTPNINVGVVTATSFIGDGSGLTGVVVSGEYVQSISGTANQITVTGGTGEGSTPTLSIPSNPTLPGNVTIANDLQVNNNLNVTGNITVGGTSAYIIANDFRVKDSDIILGFTTNISGQDVSNDTTANHGGIAIASTEGNPLVQLVIAGIETAPVTYKKIMWFKAGSFAGLNTDAWLSNYAIGIGSTQFPSGTRLAAGNVQFTENDLVVVRNINASGNVGIGTIDPQTKLEINGILGFTTTTVFGSTYTNIRLGTKATGNSLTSGQNNFFAGIGAGSSTTNGYNNNFIGKESGYFNINGFSNNFIGNNAGYNNSSGDNNNFIGDSAGYYNTIGYYNIFFGWQSGYSNISGDYNVFVGSESGGSNTIGNDNVAIGLVAGYYNMTGSKNVFLGSYTGISTSSSHKVIIGSGGYYSSGGGGSNAYYFDSPDTTKNIQFAVGVRTDSNNSKYWLVGDENFNIGIGTTNPTSKLSVVGDVSVTGISTFSSRVDLKQITETVSNNFNTTLSPSTGTLTIDTSLGSVILGDLNASVTTWAFTNVPTENGKATTITIIIDGDTAQTYGDACSVNGSAVSGGIKWSGGTSPTSTNNFDILSFTIVKDGAGTINVFGSGNTNFS